MTIYVAAIKGRGVAAFQAQSGVDAEIRTRDRVFRDDLMVLASDHQPLWDGKTDIHIRQALPHEEEKWLKSRARAIRLGNIDGNDDAWVAFLVALTDFDRGTR